MGRPRSPRGRSSQLGYTRMPGKNAAPAIGNGPRTTHAQKPGTTAAEAGPVLPGPRCRPRPRWLDLDHALLPSGADRSIPLPDRASPLAVAGNLIPWG